MKLLELLVQKTLTGEFKWPKRASQIFQDYDSELRPDAEMPGVYLDPVAENHRICGVPFDELSESYIVTREQYEAALAAAQQPVWNGEGLPPVGCEVEYLTGILGKPDADDNKPENGQIVKVVSHAKYENTGNEVVVATWLNGNGGMRASVFSPRCLQPIRSEADKKRAEIIEEIAYHTSLDDARDLYEAIAAGQVKGVKLDV